MLYKVFDFAGKEVHEVMVPRPEVVAVSVDLPPEECLAAVIDSPYTRYPAYRGSVDEIAGILHVRDLFSALNDRGIANVSIEEILRPAFVVPETKDLAALLGDFRRTKNHMAIVIDEYGSMEGLITLEDVLEEIVGEIEDEYDLPDEAVERVGRVDDPDRRHVPDRRLQRAVRDRAAAGGLPHGRGLRLRAARPGARGGRRGRARAAALPRPRARGVADRAARGSTGSRPESPSNPWPPRVRESPRAFARADRRGAGRPRPRREPLPPRGRAPRSVVADVVEEAAAALAGEVGADAAHPEELLERDDVEAVLVTTPPDTHAALVEAAAGRGKHVFCEKPLAPSVEEARGAVEACERAGVLLQVGYNRRFDPSFRAVRDAVRDGRVGKPWLLRISSRDPEPPPGGYLPLSGGLFLDTTSHDLDLARFVLGADIVEVAVRAAALTDPNAAAIGDVDTAIVSLVFSNGALGAIDNTRRSVYGYDQRLEVHGSAGLAQARQRAQLDGDVRRRTGLPRAAAAALLPRALRRRVRRGARVVRRGARRRGARGHRAATGWPRSPPPRPPAARWRRIASCGSRRSHERDRDRLARRGVDGRGALDVLPARADPLPRVRGPRAARRRRRRGRGARARRRRPARLRARRRPTGAR